MCGYTQLRVLFVRTAECSIAYQLANHLILDGICILWLELFVAAMHSHEFLHKMNLHSPSLLMFISYIGRANRLSPN